MAAALERLLKSGLAGDALVFLPGAAEIRRAARVIGALAERAGLLVLPLHGDLSPAEQDRAVGPADRRKVILSTNVAESSVTIEGIAAVIDSGLARVAADSPWTGIPSLHVQRISQASATQRAGRAGRTGPGRVIRLYTAEDFHRRPTRRYAGDPAARAIANSASIAGDGIAELEWLDAPPPAALAAANSLLDQLGDHSRDGGSAPSATARQAADGSRAAWSTGKRLRRGGSLKRGRTRIGGLAYAGRIGLAAANRRIFEQLRREVGRTSWSAAARPGPPERPGVPAADQEVRPTSGTRRFFNPFWRRFRIVSRGIAATGICCFPPEARRVFRAAATNSSSPSTWKNAGTAACPWYAWPRRSSPSGCSKRQPSEPPSNGIARPSESNR